MCGRCGRLKLQSFRAEITITTRQIHRNFNPIPTMNTSNSSHPTTPQTPAPSTPEPTFSLFDTATNRRPSDHLSLSELVEGIHSGRWNAEVEQCRAILHERGVDAYKASRGAVAAVTLSAKLKHRRRGTTLEQREAAHSGLLQLDFDAKDFNGMSVEEIRKIVWRAPFVAACFLSLSGDGIKAIALCPASFETHAGSWLAAEAYFRERGLMLDPSTKDPCRLCFVSSDVHAVYWDEATEIVPLATPEKGPSGEGSNGTEDPEHVRRVLARLADKIGQHQDRNTWIHICGCTKDAVGADAAGEIVDEYFPPLEPHHDSARDVMNPLTGTWLSLRKYEIDPVDHAKLLPDLSDEEKSANPEAAKAPEMEPFPIVRAGLNSGVTMAADFVEGVLTEGGASVLYGPSNCGKSFWILDLAVAVATGKPFRNKLEVDQGAVIYVALEGSHGVKNRIEALTREGKLPDGAPLFLCHAPVSLLNPKHAGKLAASVKLAADESGLPCRLVILDTMARAMAGGDENSGMDMTEAVKSIDAIRAATGAHVSVVHHCGKDEARGARGHSSLRAAVDTEIEVSRPDGETISTVRVTKQRDLPMGDAMPFSLVSVTLGTDRRGKPVTSCVVRHEGEEMAAKPGRAGRKAKSSPVDMLRHLPAATVKEWKDRVHEETGLNESQFYAHKKTLEDAGRIRREPGTRRILRTDSIDALPEMTEDI